MCTIAYLCLQLCNQSYAQAPIRVSNDFEDSVRIAVLYVSQPSQCILQPIEAQVNFVIKSLDTNKVADVVLIDGSEHDAAFGAGIGVLLEKWGPGRPPHVVIFINGGNEDTHKMHKAVRWCVSLGAGFVNIGTKSTIIREIYDLDIEERWEPWDYGMWLWEPQDSVYISMHPDQDTLPAAPSHSGYNGILHNAAALTVQDASIPRNLLLYKSQGGSGRCRAEGDWYNDTASINRNRVLHAGHLQGVNALPDAPATWTHNVNSAKVTDTIARGTGTALDPEKLPAITFIEDTYDRYCRDTVCRTDQLRRGDPYPRFAVSLAFEPNEFEHPQIVQQLLYDAVMYAAGHRERHNIPVDPPVTGIAKHRQPDENIDLHITGTTLLISHPHVQSLRITGATGKLVASLAGGTAGSYRLLCALPQGIYLAQLYLTSGKVIHTRFVTETRAQGVGNE
ncbi:MAG: hypothetical protein GF398_08785 [Chitinivibrionales bacterium]|nr:hypothetical protein [Chitinivibrionales bacterium]